MSTTSAAALAFGRARAPFEAAVERARLTVVPHRRRVRAPRMPFVTLVSVVLLAGIVGLLCFNTQMQQASFAATTLEERAASLDARAQTLHSELQELRDPQHLGVMAAQAGMVAPKDECVLRVGGPAAETSCTAATGGSTPMPLHPGPPKPAAIDPAPVVVLVQPPADLQPARTRNKNKNQDQQGRDTGRG